MSFERFKPRFSPSFSLLIALSSGGTETLWYEVKLRKDHQFSCASCGSREGLKKGDAAFAPVNHSVMYRMRRICAKCGNTVPRKEHG